MLCVVNVYLLYFEAGRQCSVLFVGTDIMRDAAWKLPTYCTSSKTKQALLESVCKGQRQQLAWTCLQTAFPLRKKIVDDERPRPGQVIVQLLN
jgi:hypothetical protein